MPHRSILFLSFVFSSFFLSAADPIWDNPRYLELDCHAEMAPAIYVLVKESTPTIPRGPVLGVSMREIIVEPNVWNLVKDKNFKVLEVDFIEAGAPITRDNNGNYRVEIQNLIYKKVNGIKTCATLKEAFIKISKRQSVSTASVSKRTL